MEGALRYALALSVAAVPCEPEAFSADRGEEAAERLDLVVPEASVRERRIQREETFVHARVLRYRISRRVVWSQSDLPMSCNVEHLHSLRSVYLTVPAQLDSEAGRRAPSGEPEANDKGARRLELLNALTWPKPRHRRKLNLTRPHRSD